MATKSSSSSKLFLDEIIKPILPVKYPPTLEYEHERIHVEDFCLDRGKKDNILLKNIALEYDKLSEHSASRDIHKDVRVDGHIPFDLEFSFVDDKERELRREMMGSPEIDATIMTVGDDWFYEFIRKNHPVEVREDLSLPIKVVSRGIMNNRQEECVKFWKMIDTLNIGLVVTTLGEESEDFERCAWSFTKKGEKKGFYKSKNDYVSFELFSQNPSEILPANLVKVYENLNGLKKGQYYQYSDAQRLSQLFCCIRQYEYVTDQHGYEAKTLIHIVVVNWHDMYALTRSNELQFLKNLTLLINSIESLRNDKLKKGLDLTNCHRQLFHCSAGVGRSNVTMASTLLSRNEIVKNNLDIYDMVWYMKQQRIFAVHGYAHYLSLYLFAIRYANREDVEKSLLQTDKLLKK